MSTSKSVLMYDADCGPCSTFKALVSFLDVRRSVTFMPLRQADADGLMRGIPEGLRYSSAHLLLPDGDVISGAQAMIGLVGIFPGGRLVSRLVSLWEPGMRFSEFLYSVVSRLHNTRPCGVEV